MVSEAVDVSLATFFYSIGGGVILSLFGCYFYTDVYQKCCVGRGGAAAGAGSITTDPSAAATNTSAITTSKKKTNPNLALQLCTINIYDDPLIGTIRTIQDITTTTTTKNCDMNEALTFAATSSSKQTNTSTTRNRTVADFGNNILIPLDSIGPTTSDGDGGGTITTTITATQCSICLNEYCINESVYRNDPTKCRHLFHTDCILMWIHQQHSRTGTTGSNMTDRPSEPECPICRCCLAVTIVNPSTATDAVDTATITTTTTTDPSTATPTPTATISSPEDDFV